MIHVSSNLDEKQRNYGCSKLFFVNYSRNMSAIVSRYLGVGCPQV